MAVYRDGINLTKLSDAKLKEIVAQLRSNVEVARQADFVATFAQNYGARKFVFLSAITIDAWETINTVTTVSAPSPESLAWSNLEGGHTFHQVPSVRKFLSL